MEKQNLKLTMNKPFKIPLQSEVVVFIKEKSNWPQKFCEYYAEKFWSHYNSNGWKVSGKAAMKSWTSAFLCNWQQPRFKEDVDFLNKCIAEDPSIPSKEKQPSQLNWWLTQYTKHWDKITDQQLASMYDYMKERKVLKMTPEEKDQVKKNCNGDVTKGKALCIKIIFNKMITNNEHFQ